MLRGLTTTVHPTDDVAATAAWYADVLGVEPYFVRPEDGPPAYVEFRLGDGQDELGFVDRRFVAHGAAARPAGAISYWHVDDVPAALAAFVAGGATEHEAVTEREAGFVTATVCDPFGNLIGLMHSPHHLETLR